MEKVAWVATVVGAVLGILILFLGMLGASSAVQEVSICSLAVAFAVIPCCLARALTEIRRIKRGDI